MSHRGEEHTGRRSRGRGEETITHSNLGRVRNKSGGNKLAL